MKKKMPKKSIQVVDENLKGGSSTDILPLVANSRRAISLMQERGDVKSVLGVREMKRQRELDEILEGLQEMVRKDPETAFRYADKIAAMKLKAELDGHLKTHGEEQHLHIHGELGQMSEEQLRRELRKVEAERLQSSNAVTGTPVVG